MSATKHTPGPWTFRELRGHDGLGYIEADGRDIIHAGVTDLSADENRANARLIAAAPEMLEALKAMVLNDRHTYRDCHKAALAAIAKATGGQS